MNREKENATMKQWKCESCQFQCVEFLPLGLSCPRCQEVADMLGKSEKTQETQQHSCINKIRRKIQMKKSVHLIDQVYSIAGCEYLSSLKEIKMRPLLFQSISKVNFSDHTYKEWSEALSYFFVEEVEIDSSESFWAFLDMKATWLDESKKEACIA